jgi:hypothetical protein
VVSVLRSHGEVAGSGPCSAHGSPRDGGAAMAPRRQSPTRIRRVGSQPMSGSLGFRMVEAATRCRPHPVEILLQVVGTTRDGSSGEQLVEDLGGQCDAFGGGCGIPSHRVSQIEAVHHGLDHSRRDELVESQRNAAPPHLAPSDRATTRSYRLAVHARCVGETQSVSHVLRGATCWSRRFPALGANSSGDDLHRDVEDQSDGLDDLGEDRPAYVVAEHGHAVPTVVGQPVRSARVTRGE